MKVATVMAAEDSSFDDGEFELCTTEPEDDTQSSTSTSSGRFYHLQF